MKCSNCGEKTVGIYKEVRQAMCEMGFDKAYLEEQVRATVQAVVNSVLGQSVQEVVKNEAKNKINSYSYGREFNALVREAVANEITKVLENRIKISIDPKEIGV